MIAPSTIRILARIISGCSVDVPMKARNIIRTISSHQEFLVLYQRGDRHRGAADKERRRDDDGVKE
jgi:hypothetical protein